MDLLQREGKYPVPAGASKILGVEFSGVIEEVGKEAGEWKAGDEVFGLAYGGCYAEFVVVSVKMLVRKPAELSWEVAAGIPEVRNNHFSIVFIYVRFFTGQYCQLNTVALFFSRSFLLV